MLRVLLTNDDGIQAEGLRRLALQLAPRCEVLVVAPEKPSSGTGHSLTLHKPLRLKAVPDFAAGAPAAAPVQAYACSGTPTDCVMLGLLHQFKGQRIDLLLSGINDGCNVAQDLSYSGTVGAALEGAVIGVPSLALSLDGHERLSFSQAAELAELVLALLVYGSAPPWLSHLVELLRRPPLPLHDCWELPLAAAWPGCVYPDPRDWPECGPRLTLCLNLNFPDVALADLRGVAWTLAGHREYVDIVSEHYDPRGRPYYWIGGERVEHQQQRPGTDLQALQDGLVSVTPVSYDITNLTDLPLLKQGLRERMAARLSL